MPNTKFILLADYLSAFAPLIILGIVMVALMIMGLGSLIYSIGCGILRWYDGIVCDDAAQIMKNHLSNLGSWQPYDSDLREFGRQELRIRQFANRAKSYNPTILKTLVAFLLGYRQAESAIVIAICENDDELQEVLWLRYYREEQWWVLWRNPNPDHKKDDFRAFPEAGIETEIEPECGRVIITQMVMYNTVRRYFR